MTAGQRSALRHGFDAAPAILFLAVLLITRDFRLATWVVVGGALVSLIAGYALERRLRPLPVITAAMALVFGGVSLALHSKDILKMKMTIVDGLLGAVLFGGLMIGRNPLKGLLGGAFDLDDRAWATLAIRYGAFWWGCAVVNEIVRRTQTDATWAAFRVAAIVAAVVFALAQTPFLLKHNRRIDRTVMAEPPDGGP